MATPPEAATNNGYNPHEPSRRQLSWMPIFFLPALLLTVPRAPPHLRPPLFVGSIALYGTITFYMFGSAKNMQQVE